MSLIIWIMRSRIYPWSLKVCCKINGLFAWWDEYKNIYRRDIHYFNNIEQCDPVYCEHIFAILHWFLYLHKTWNRQYLEYMSILIFSKYYRNYLLKFYIDFYANNCLVCSILPLLFGPCSSCWCYTICIEWYCYSYVWPFWTKLAYYYYKLCHK